MRETAPTFAARLHFWARNASNESAVLHAAFRLGLFERLRQPLTLSALAQGMCERGVRSLVELLQSIDFVRADADGRLQLEPTLAARLADPTYDARLREALAWWEPLSQLSQAVRSGQPVEHQGRRFDLLRHLAAEVTPAEDPFFDAWARSFVRSRVLTVAGQSGLLEAVPSAPTVAQAAQQLGLSPAGVQALVDALTAMEMLAPGETLRFSEAAVPLMDGKGLPYFVKALAVSAMYWEALSHVDETVRSEKFYLDLKDPVVSSAFYAENSNQITNVFASHFALSRRAALTLETVRPLRGCDVLDIGTGSGVWGAAFGHRGANVTYFDQPVVLEHVRQNLARLKLTEGARFMPGNLFADAFGTHAFDVIILPQVLNVLRPEQMPGMFDRVAQALRPGGVLLIAEYVLHDSRTGPLDHLYFSFRRFITNEGDLLSLPEYQAHLRRVGLTEARLYPLTTQEMILAHRGDARLPERLVEGGARAA